MSKTAGVLRLYGALVAVFCALVVFLSLRTDSVSKQEKEFVRFSTFSDPAFYSNVLGVRFHSLVTPQELYDDPVLPLHNKSDFVYRVDDE